VLRHRLPFDCEELVRFRRLCGAGRFAVHAITCAGERGTAGVTNSAETEEPRRGSCFLKLLDGFELVWRGTVVHLSTGSQRVAAFLALQAKPVPRSFVAGNLWLKSSEERAHASLRSALWRLHHCEAPVVTSTREYVGLLPSVAVDVREQVRIASRMIRSGADIDDIDDRAVLEGELLPGWYDEWVVLERERLRQLRLHALEELADSLCAEARFGEAVEMVMTAIRVDPLRETAHHALIKIYVAESNVTDAIRHYEQYSQLLHRRLGIEPSPHVRQLIADVRPNRPRNP
jgi:DNA-binding SARP family transcriptional activator